MRPPDNEIGKKIIKIVYQHEPQGIGVRELLRKTGLSRNGLYGWLNHFREYSILRNDPKFPIRLTEKALKEYEENPDIITDLRRRNNELREKEIHSILLILSSSAFGSLKYKKIDPKQYLAEKKLPGITIDDVVYKLKHKYGSSNPKARFFKNKINFTNMELFGYLRLTRNDVEKYFSKLTKYDPPILEEIKHGNQTRFIIKDKELEEFIKTCFIIFGQDVYSILAYLYIFDRLNDPSSYYSEMWKGKYTAQQREQQIKSYIEDAKWAKKRSYYYKKIRAELTRENSKWQWEQIIEESRELMKKWFGQQRILYTHFRFNEGILTSTFDQVFEGAIKDIHKCNIFDDKLEGINKKYKILEEKYRYIIEAFLDTLFPVFFRDIIKEEYMKNVTIKNKLKLMMFLTSLHYTVF